MSYYFPHMCQKHLAAILGLVEKNVFLESGNVYGVMSSNGSKKTYRGIMLYAHNIWPEQCSFRNSNIVFEENDTILPTSEYLESAFQKQIITDDCNHIINEPERCKEEDQKIMNIDLELVKFALSKQLKILYDAIQDCKTMSTECREQFDLSTTIKDVPEEFAAFLTSKSNQTVPSYDNVTNYYLSKSFRNYFNNVCSYSSVQNLTIFHSLSATSDYMCNPDSFFDETHLRESSRGKVRRALFVHYFSNYMREYGFVDADANVYDSSPFGLSSVHENAVREMLFITLRDFHSQMESTSTNIKNILRLPLISQTYRPHLGGNCYAFVEQLSGHICNILKALSLPISYETNENETKKIVNIIFKNATEESDKQMKICFREAYDCLLHR